MHVEVPKSKTLKEFGGEYLMIVISILTALALEQVLETVHHKHLAHEAGTNIEAELRENAQDVARVLVHNEQKVAELRAVRDQMLEAVKVGGADKALLERFRKDWGKSIGMSLKQPSLHREAWETAVANQSVTWLPRDQLTRYATAYGAMRDMSALLSGGAMNFLDAARMQDTFTDVQMGDGDPRAIVRTVTQMIAAYGNIDGNLAALKRDLDHIVAADQH